jgi:hypothetical protein
MNDNADVQFDLGGLNGTMVMVRGKAPVPLGVSVSVGDQVFRVVS